MYCLGCGGEFPTDGLTSLDHGYPLSNGMCAACVRESRKRPWQIVAENERLREERDDLYDALYNETRPEVERLRAVLQTILDMPCPLGREGDLLGAAQRIASEAFNPRSGGKS